MATPRVADRLLGGPVGFTPTLEEILGWEYGAALTQLSYRYRDGIWTALIKADIRGSAKIAFIDVGSFGRCVEVANERVARRWLHWKDDIHPPKTRTYRRGR